MSDTPRPEEQKPILADQASQGMVRSRGNAEPEWIGKILSAARRAERGKQVNGSLTMQSP